LYTYDRFLLGPALLLMPFFGIGLAHVWGQARDRLLIPRRTLVTALLVYMLLYAASINALMTGDTRYSAERWLLDHIESWDSVGAIGRREYLPRIFGLGVKRLPISRRALVATKACVLVVNETYFERFARRTRGAEMVSALRDGTHGFVPVVQFEAKPPIWAVLTRTWVFDMRGESRVSNLDKISPTLTVYARPGCTAFRPGAD
jgi:hypothetical protein